MYYAHSADNGRLQPLDEHLNNVSELAGKNAEAIGLSEQAKVIGLYHDLGKSSISFQQRLNGGAIVDHSTAGAYECAKAGMLWAAECIAGHHTGLPNVGNARTDTSATHTLFGRLQKAKNKEIPRYEVPTIFQITPTSLLMEDNISASFVIKMLFSALVDADYTDTSSFVNLNQKFANYATLPEINQIIDAYLSSFGSPTTELNKIRADILKQVNAFSSKPRGIFTYSAPTGCGKTISSLSFAVKHAIANGMDRVIYVIPYTSIIEQTSDVFINKVELGYNNVLEHDSNTDYDQGNYDEEIKNRLYLASENYAMPIIVTTAVQFFESIYSNKPSKCRKLHNIANSVIIFDEAQTLPLIHLEPCVVAMTQLVKNFKSSIVLCTATQPALNDLIEKYCPGKEIIELCPSFNEISQKIKRNRLVPRGVMTTKELESEINNLEQVLVVVNTKKGAEELYNSIDSDDKFHLSTRMCAVHRQKTIAQIKYRLANGLPCKVVSTSLIEAGVDIDFPTVYSEIVGMSSIVQRAGRCNREGKRHTYDSIVYVFEWADHKPPKNLETEIAVTKQILSSSDNIDMFDSIAKYFNILREVAGDRIDQQKIIPALEYGINGCVFPFETISENFHMIDSNAFNVFVPYDDYSKQLLDTFNYYEPSKKTIKSLGKYTVPVYKYELDSLVSSGKVKLYYDSLYVLVDNNAYSNELGLCVDSINSTKDYF